MDITNNRFDSVSKRDALVEILVAIGGCELVRLAVNAQPLKGFVPQMPVLGRVWMLFLYTLLVQLWLWRRYDGDLSSFGLKRMGALRLLSIVVIGVIASIVIDSSTVHLFDSLFGKRILTRFVDLPHNLPAYLACLAAGLAFGGYGEEFRYRGVLLTRLQVLFGAGRASLVAALIVQATIFALSHAYQGPSGMISVGIGGLIFGIIFVIGPYNLWPAALTHGLLDALGFTLFYLGVMKPA